MKLEFLLAATSLAGCSTAIKSPNPQDPTNDGAVALSRCNQTSQCPMGAVLSGRVFAPNGVDPIAGATVYVPTSSAGFQPGASCDLCLQNFPSCTQVTSAADGSFTL